MKFLDLIKQEKQDILNKMSDAIKNDQPEAFAQAVAEFADYVQQEILRDAKELAGVTDAAILAQRGIRQLTANEREYFQKLGEAMKAADPRAAISNIDIVLPETEINEVFKYLRDTHPLLDAIDFVNTSAVTRWIMSTSTGVAAWGGLTDEVKSELGGAFQEMDMTLYSLSAFFPVSRAMLDLGPEWLERWIRTILAEALAVGLESAIVDGDGENKPIGMTRALSGAVDGVYPRKTPMTIEALDPATFGAILNVVSQTSNNKRRAVPELLMVVNPEDYYTKVFPATTVRRTDGGYNTNVLPYPTRIVTSSEIPAGHAVFGLAREYFVGLGTAKGGRVLYSDDYKFLERQRIYLIELYGNGRPKDENAFVYADISNLKPTVLEVKVTDSGSGE